jgi:hypothetical protein
MWPPLLSFILTHHAVRAAAAHNWRLHGDFGRAGRKRERTGMSTPPPLRSVDIVLAAFAAVKARDERRLSELCHPQVEFHWPPSLPYGGVARGAEAARADRGWELAWQPAATHRC